MVNVNKRRGRVKPDTQRTMLVTLETGRCLTSVWHFQIAPSYATSAYRQVSIYERQCRLESRNSGRKMHM